MTLLANHRQRILAIAGACALVLAVPATPKGRDLTWIVGVDFVGVTERVLRFPFRLLDHRNCLFLDRLDPTCPQCM